MFCKNCGAELKPGVAFCTACGAPAKPSTAAVAATTQPPSPQRPAPLSHAKQRGGRRKVLGALAVVLVIFLGLVVYGNFVSGLLGGSSSTSQSQNMSQSGILAGSRFYNGTLPTPTTQTLNAGTGAQASVFSFPGQVVMAGSSSATLASVQDVVSKYGGTLLSYAPSAGFYVASSGSQDESTFMANLNSSGLFVNVGPDMAATRASAIGPPILLDTQLFAEDTLRTRIAGIQSDVVMVIVDNFASPNAHGFRVADALDAAYSQPYIEVEDSASNGVVSSSAAIRAILAAIDAAQAANKKVVINWSSFGSCGYPAPGCSEADEHYNWRILEREILFTLDAIDLAGQTSWVHQGNVVLTQASGNSGIDISSDLQALNMNPQVNSVLRNNLELCGLLALDGQSVWPMSNYGSSTANLGPNYYQVGVDFVRPPGVNYASGTSFAAPVCASYAYTTWIDNPQYTSTEVIQTMHGGESVLPVGARVLNPPTNGTTNPKTTSKPPATGDWSISLSFSLKATANAVSGDYYTQVATYQYSGSGQFTVTRDTYGGVSGLKFTSFQAALQVSDYPGNSCPPTIVGCPNGGTPPANCAGTSSLALLPSPEYFVSFATNPPAIAQVDLFWIDASIIKQPMTLSCADGSTVSFSDFQDCGGAAFLGCFFLGNGFPIVVNLPLTVGSHATANAPFGTSVCDSSYWWWPYGPGAPGTGCTASLSGYVTFTVVSGPSG